MDIEGLPGWRLIATGLADLANGRESIGALLVACGRPRLERLGFSVPVVPSPEHRLYQLLAQTDPDSAHSRYNALLRQPVSFERAAECAA
jgi:hypothetical protein